MDLSGRRNSDKLEETDRNEAPAKPRSTAPRTDEAAAETQINLVSPFAHPRGAKVAKFALRDFVTSHPIPVALSCLALGGTIAAIILKRRRRDTWDARIGRLRESFGNAANDAG
jgi:hypothetical protein